jgi:hypothetical protein
MMQMKLAALPFAVVHHQCVQLLMPFQLVSDVQHVVIWWIWPSRMQSSWFVEKCDSPEMMRKK